MADDIAKVALEFDSSKAKQGAEEFQAAGQKVLAVDQQVQASAAKTAGAVEQAEGRKSKAADATGETAGAAGNAQVQAAEKVATATETSTNRIVTAMSSQTKMLDSYARQWDPLAAAVQKAQRQLEGVKDVIAQGGTEASRAAAMMTEAQGRLTASTLALAEAQGRGTPMQQAAAKAMQELKDKLDPAAKAQLAFKEAVAFADKGLAEQTLTTVEHRAAVGLAQKELEAFSESHGHLAGGSGKAREGLVLFHEFLRGDWKRGVGSATIELNNFGLSHVIFNPYVLGAVAALGLFGAAVAKSLEQSRQLREISNDLVLFGDAAGLAKGQLESLAQATALSTGQSVSSVRSQEEALLHFATIGGAVYSGIMKIQDDYAAARKLDAEKSIAELGKMFSDPAKGAEELQQQYQRLTFAQVEHVAELQKAGDLYGAHLALLKLVTEQYEGARERGLTPMTAATRELKVAVSDLFEELGQSAPVQAFMDHMTQMIVKMKDVTKEAGTTKGAVDSFFLSGGGLFGVMAAANVSAVGAIAKWFQGSGKAPGAGGSGLVTEFDNRPEAFARSSAVQDTGQNVYSNASDVGPNQPALAGGQPRGAANAMDAAAEKAALARDKYATAQKKFAQDEDAATAALVRSGIAFNDVGKLNDQMTDKQRSLTAAVQGARNAAVALISPEQEITEHLRREAELVGKSADERRKLTAQWRVDDQVRQAVSSKELSDGEMRAERLKAEAAAFDKLGTSLERKGEAENRAYEAAKGGLLDQIAKYTDLGKVGQDTHDKLLAGATKLTGAHAAEVQQLSVTADAVKALDSASKAYAADTVQGTTKAMGAQNEALLKLTADHANLATTVMVAGDQLSRLTKGSAEYTQVQGLVGAGQQQLNGYAVQYAQALTNINEAGTKLVAKENERAQSLEYTNKITALEIIGSGKSAEEITKLRIARQHDTDELARRLALAPSEAAVETASASRKANLAKLEDLLAQAHDRGVDAQIQKTKDLIASDDVIIADAVRTKDGINAAWARIEAANSLKIQLEAAKVDSNVFSKGIQTTFENMGKGIQDAISKSLTDLFSGGLKTAKDFATSLKSVLQQGLAQFAGGLVSSGINSVLGPTFKSIAGGIGGLFSGQSGASNPVSLAVMGGSKNPDGSVTTASGSTFSAADVLKMGSQGMDLFKGGGGGLFGGIDNAAASILPSWLYSAPQAATISAASAASAGIPAGISIAEQAPGGAISAAGSAASGGIAGTGIGASAALGAVGGIAGIYNFASNPTIGSGITMVGTTMTALSSMFASMSALGPYGMAIAAVGMLVSSLMGNKVAAHDSAVLGGAVVDGKLGYGTAVVDKMGDPKLVGGAVKTVADSVNTLGTTLGLKLDSANIPDYNTKFGSAVKDYNAFYGPDFIGEHNNGIQEDLAKKLDYQHQVKADDQGAIDKMAQQVAFILAKDPGSWKDMPEPMQRALKNSKAMDMPGLTDDLTFVKNLTDTLTALKAAGGGAEKQIKDLKDAADTAGKALGDQITTNLVRVGDLLGKDQAEYADTIAAGKTAVMNALGLAIPDPKQTSELTGLNLQIKQSTFSLQAFQPAMEALGYTTAQQTDLINKAVNKATGLLHDADAAGLDVAIRNAQGRSYLDSISGLQSQADVMLQGGSDAKRVNTLLTQQFINLAKSLDDSGLADVIANTTGQMKQLAGEELVRRNNLAAASTAQATADANASKMATAAAAATTDLNSAMNQMAASATAAQAGWALMMATIVSGVQAAGQAIGKTAQDIATYILGLSTSDLSPYSPEAKYTIAGQQFAANQNTATAGTLLSNGVSYLGKGGAGYANLYSSTVGSLANVGAAAAGRGATANLDSEFLGWQLANGLPSEDLSNAVNAQRTAQMNAAVSQYMASLGLVGHAQGAGVISGVVHSPSFFADRGGRGHVMGEAGPEAILPLLPMPGGSLGVRAAQGGDAAAAEVKELQKQMGQVIKLLTKLNQVTAFASTDVVNAVERGNKTTGQMAEGVARQVAAGGRR